MGRKGIGKLSLFSIANKITVYTVKNGERTGFKMELEKIREKINENNDQYNPEPVEVPKDLVCGTRIVIEKSKKRLSRSEKALRKRLARRFGIISPEHNFQVTINEKPISINDRDYFYRIKDIWFYGDSKDKYMSHCTSLENVEIRPSKLEVYTEPLTDGEKPKKETFEISGWIGAVRSSGDLKDEFDDNLNRLIIQARGKLVVENMLEEFTDRRLFSGYLIGEIQADFLDMDDMEDITTSNRQSIKVDDPRYIALRNFILEEVRYIGNQWTDLRQKDGIKQALIIPEVEEWFKSLRRDDRIRAEKLFGKINQIHFDNEEQSRSLLKHSVIAFESLNLRDRLDMLDNIQAEDLTLFTTIFESIDEIEAVYYHQIAGERVKIIQTLQEKVGEDEREKVLQEFLFNHLWLLDPGWERATGTKYMEREIKTLFKEIDSTLDKEILKGRVDIGYRTTSGKHLIIELKRASIVLEAVDLVKQCNKYRLALRDLLQRANISTFQNVEVICVIGRDLKDWRGSTGREDSEKMLSSINARVITYQELLENAYKAYNEYLKATSKVNRIAKILDSIDTAVLFR